MLPSLDSFGSDKYKVLRVSEESEYGIGILSRDNVDSSVLSAVYEPQLVTTFSGFDRANLPVHYLGMFGRSGSTGEFIYVLSKAASIDTWNVDGSLGLSISIADVDTAR